MFDFRNMEWFLSMQRMSITLLSSALALTTSKSTNSMERSVSHCCLQSQRLQHQTNKLSGEVSITLLSSVSALTTSKPTNSVERSVSHCCLQSQHLQHQNQQTQWRGQYHTAVFREVCRHLLHTHCHWHQRCLSQQPPQCFWWQNSW